MCVIRSLCVFFQSIFLCFRFTPLVFGQLRDSHMLAIRRESPNESDCRSGAQQLNGPTAVSSRYYVVSSCTLGVLMLHHSLSRPLLLERHREHGKPFLLELPKLRPGRLPAFEPGGRHTS